jgi:hypothetical protein
MRYDGIFPGENTGYDRIVENDIRYDGIYCNKIQWNILGTQWDIIGKRHELWRRIWDIKRI